MAFLVLGSTGVEPLDFWWAPLDGWMVAAYAVILAGGLLITARLRLLAMAVAFWIALAAGVGVLAASGHCMTVAWAFAPVCGFDYWRVIVTSPEVLIFLFFMITDPKTVPTGRVGACSAVLVAVVSTLLMAPQTNEFGTKVGAPRRSGRGCAVRPLLDRARFPVTADPAAAPVRAWAALVGAARAPRRSGSSRPAVPRGPWPRRCPPDVLVGSTSTSTPATFPTISVDQDVALTGTTRSPGRRELVLTLAENLAARERGAAAGRRHLLLEAVDHGERLDEMAIGARIEAAATAGRLVADYQFDDVHLGWRSPSASRTGPEPRPRVVGHGHEESPTTPAGT